MLARQAIRWLRSYHTVDERGFRRNLHYTFEEPRESIYRRLELDAGGEVSLALVSLMPDGFSQKAQIQSSGLILFDIAQAAGLALTSSDVEWRCQLEQEKNSQQAENARQLLAFCKGHAPMELWSTLAPLAAFLEEQAERYKQMPDKMQIKRTNKTKTAPMSLALRNFAKRLREERGIKHPAHSAVECLVRVALDLPKPVPGSVVAHALRLKMQVGKDCQRAELTKPRNSLKTKEAPKRVSR